MTHDECEYIRDVLRAEGIDSGLNHYTGFRQVKDSIFHLLLEQYREARSDLLDHIGFDE